MVKNIPTNFTEIRASKPGTSTRVICIFRTSIANTADSADTAKRKDGGVSGPKSSNKPIVKIGKVVQRSAPNKSLPYRSAPESIPTAIAIPPTLGVGTV
jgi:hypothetical protein